MTKARDLSQVPNASLGFKNRIINGAMMIDQRNAGASVTPSTAPVFTLDRWKCTQTQASKFSVQQNAGSVTPPSGFTNYAGITSLSAYSVLTGDTFNFRQLVEGFNAADLAWGTANAATVTLSFWVRSSLTGTFSGALNNAAFDRSYPFTYTISSANTWEQKSVTIAGDTTGTWNKTNDVGIGINFSLGQGSTYNGTAGAWAAGTLLGATGAVNLVSTNGATFYITGVQLEKGSTATSFDYRPYGTELALCQRYYYRLTASGSGGFLVSGSSAVTSTLTRGLVQFPVTMRTAPTSLEQTGTASDYQVVAGGGAINCSSVPSLADATTSFLVVGSTVASGLTVGGSNYVRSNNSNVYFGFSAEL
jgi:hypothetical protein